MKSVHPENLQSVKESRSQWLILYFRVSIKKSRYSSCDEGLRRRGCVYNRIPYPVRTASGMRKETNLTIRALIRVTSGNQFGVDESELEDIIANRTQYPNIDFYGIQCYTGTQKKR